mmetsp:Transcript_8343/g.21958  ORF Transcript_8343/g.21958 Transcript_8343/m.21958 type:complete len:642 (+) Transcript_8343:42-1967(+)
MERRAPGVTPALVFVVLLCVGKCGTAFYLPGISPVDYEEGYPLEVFANRLVSPVNKVPFSFYSVPYFRGDLPKKPKSKHRNLGQILSGEMVTPTKFEIEMLVRESCKILTKDVKLTAKEVRKVAQRVKSEYRVRLNLDNMPLIVRRKSPSGSEVVTFGFPLGAQMESSENAEVFIFNHLAFRVLYHMPAFVTAQYLQSGAKPAYRIVGFEVTPQSIAHDPRDVCKRPDVPSPQKLVADQPIAVTYSVDFVESPIRWATRWDGLLQATSEQKSVMWFSIVNSMLVGLFLSVLVALILFRTVYQDFVRYNRLEDDEDLQDESGWKLVHGDVFRPPRYPEVLATMLGTGAQLLSMVFVVLVFAALGFLSPANRGGLLSAMCYCWVFCSTIGGFVASRMYLSMNGQNMRLVTLGTCFAFTGWVFALFFALNLVMAMMRSTSFVPFLTLVFILFLWFGMSAPLTVLGVHLGEQLKVTEFPARTNHIPREIPPSPFGVPWWLYPALAALLPFGVVFVQLMFVLNSFWQNQVFYMFGTLFLVLLLLLVACAETSIVLTYSSLVMENYHWWWSAFLCCAYSGSYMFIYAIAFYLRTIGVKNVARHLISSLTYICYSGIISVGFGLMTGFVGFAASMLFVRRIYAAIRVE